MQLYAPIANNEGPDALLSATLTIDGLALSVTSTALMPAEGYVSIMRLGEVGEVIKVTGAAGNPYTIEREVDGTTAAEFTAGTELRHVETPTALRVLINDGPNVFTERNDFTAKLTNIERPAVPTDEEVVQETPIFAIVERDATATDPYLNLYTPEAPTDDPGVGTPYVFYNPENGEFVEASPVAVLVDRVAYSIERGAFNSPPGEWLEDTVIEVMQAGPLAVQLTFADKPRKRVQTNGRVIEFKLPNPAEDAGYADQPTLGDGAMVTLGDNASQITAGGIRVSDPVANVTDMTTRGGRIESLFDYNTTNDVSGWTTMASPSEVDPGLGLQRLTVRAATAVVLTNGPTYTAGVLNAATPGVCIIDGVTLNPGNLCLVKDQATAAHNGLYECEQSEASSNYRLRRVAWFDEDAEILAGVAVFVSEGSVNADSAWVLQTNAPFTIGTTDLAFVSLNGSDTRADFTSNTATGANTTETDLHSWTAPAGLLGKDGAKIVATFSGIFANNVNTKRLRLKYNASTILDTGVLTGTVAGTWVIEVTIMRISSTSVRYAAKAFVNGVTVTAPIVTMAELNVTNHTATKILKVTGQNGTASASDIVARMSTIEYAAAA